MIINELLSIGEYAAAGLYEETDRDLFYRKSLALRRYYEKCELAEYRGEYLYPSGVTEQKMRVAPSYLTGLSFNALSRDMLTSDSFERLSREFCAYRSSVPEEHTVAGNMYTHSIPHYERILREGLSSYTDRIKQIEDTDMREGLLHVVKGIECHLSRCIDYLESVHADRRLIDALRTVPMNPAKSAYEAIVGWNYIMYLDGCDNIGCLDTGLMPYYNGENLVPYLENLYDNLDKNNGYSMSLGSLCPSLTLQCLRAAKGRRRPMIELFVDESTPEEIWREAISTVKSGGGQPAFYNGDALLGGLKRRFPTIRSEDLKRFCGGGCTESMLAGLSNVGSLDAGINLLLILEKTIYAELARSESFESFYEKYTGEVQKTVEKVKGEINRSRAKRAKYNPLPMRTLLIDDCIERGVEYNGGGARYGWSIISFAGLINVIDSLLAIKTLVFDERKYTGTELTELLRDGNEALLSEVIRLEKCHGKDIDEVNEFAHCLSKRIFSMTEGGELIFGEGFLSASIQFSSQAYAGRNIGSTPDGRTAGSPLCDSLAAIFGKDKYGPTALLNSVTALDLSGALGVPVVNLNISNNFSDEILKALILGYMKKGGIQLQITYASREELEDAYLHPERHGNLIVRVGGYSEYFNRLPDELKRMIINRTVQEGGHQ
ncbi:MAG: hypothetical protein IJY69_04650 [Clostridia bacterium]|nr:hypothetical protein [Clostridia bacterium]